MYIRQTKTSTSAAGESYYTFRLVASERVGDKVRQRTLLNLGRNFFLARDKWPQLCARIEEILVGQVNMLPVDQELEELAQHYSAQLVVSANEAPSEKDGAKKVDYQEVDVESLHLLRPRSIGIEHAGLEAVGELGLLKIFEECGLNGPQQAAALGSIIGRMAAPGSELSTHQWLSERSGLGELIDYDFEDMSLMRLYRVSDQLLRHQQQIEKALFSRISSLFSLPTTITLYDLTNTFFEGKVPANSKARRGHSKEKRGDCPLVTLGLAVDGSGFVRRSKVFEGNVAECRTLETMLSALSASAGSMVIMDRGIATQANIDWLVSHNYRYLVVSREKTRRFAEDQAVSLTSATGTKIHIQREEDGREVRLYCYSEDRAKKDEAIAARFCKRFEEGLGQIAASLAKPRGTKKRDKVLERIGRLKEKSRGVGQHYNIDLQYDEKSEIVTSLTWRQETQPGTQLSHPGVYCLRTNEMTWNAETLWRTYTMLTDLEAVFRCLKSELGLRPIYHHKEERSDGHLFITVLAYQIVQVIRRKLKNHGVCENWVSLRRIFSVQQRVTASFRQKDGRTLHVRKATVAEPKLKQLYQYLQISEAPGGVKKLIN
jgi:transposase